MKLLKTFKRLVPLCFISETSVLCYKYGNLYKLNLSNYLTEKVLSFPFSFKYNILSRSKLLTRVLRIDARYGIKIIDDICLIVRDGIIHEIALEKKKISKGFSSFKGKRPLNIVPIDIRGFDKGFYFGEYYSNPEMLPVAIYKREGMDVWNKVFEFGYGEINHIHNLIPDENNNCVWILAGDFGKAASIWKAQNNFEKIEKILFGKQEYRSCVAWPYYSNIVYATDTPFQRNYLCVLEKEEAFNMKKIEELNGSVIYYCCVKDNLIFSSVVENNGGEPFVKKLFLRKEGSGILDRNCVIYKYSKRNSLQILHKEMKDVYPFFLFQFGAIIFPQGINNTDYLITYNIATKRNDLTLCIYNIND